LAKGFNFFSSVEKAIRKERRCDLRVNEYAAFTLRGVQKCMGAQGVQKIMGYSKE
jgi:hypothetical protein